MALSNQDSNFISRAMTWSEDMLKMRADAQLISAQWFSNIMNDSLNDEDIAEVFPHLNKAEVINFVTAVAAVLGALGELSGGNAEHLNKMRG